MANSPFPIDPDLTSISIAYKNRGYIADQIAPRIRVAKQEFKFMLFGDDTFFNIPDTLVGRRSKPNEVDLSATETVDQTFDYGLDGAVPYADVQNADTRYDPISKRVELLTELIALDRERRVSSLVFANATYPAALRQTLAGASQFSDFVNSDPIGLINDALDQPLMRPNQMTFGQAGWTKFRQHPKIVSAILGNNGTNGNVSRQQVAELFELDEVLVGASRANANKPGQAPSLVRLWGKHISLTYKAPVADAEGAVTFAGSFQWGDRIAGREDDSDIGLRGGVNVRVGESLKERVIAAQSGYFFQNAFA